MKILLYKDFIEELIFNKSENQEHKKLIRQIVNNENSIFLYSRKFAQYIKDIIEDEDLYEAWIKKLVDNGENIKSSDSSSSFDDEYLNIYNTAQANLIVAISYSNENILDSIPKVAILTKQQKPNYHWLVVQLAMIHPNTFSIRQHDFTNDNEIDNFFDSIFTIPKRINEVIIFDDYCNFGHNKFRYLNQNNIKIYYYTSRSKNNMFHKMTQKISSFEMYAKISNEKTHEREISFEGFVIIPTHDFQCLVVDNRDAKWSVHIQYNELEYNKSISYINNRYKRITT